MFATDLKEEIEVYADRLRSSSRLLALALAGEVPPAVVATYLANVRYLIVCTPRLLRRAERRALLLGREGVAAFFAAKVDEEAGHERWADQDLAGLRSLFQVSAEPGPRATIAALAARLEADIDAQPASYMGYAVFAEYFTVLLGPEWVNALSSCCGIPRSSLTVVDYHVEFDRHHAAAGFAQVSALLSDPAEEAAALQSARAGMEYLERFYDELADEAVRAGGVPPTNTRAA